MMLKITKVVWISSAIFVLMTTLYAFDGEPDSDIGVFFAWSTLVLSFPGGLIVPLMHTALDAVFSITIETSYLSFVLDWIGFVAVGYFQWFRIFPYFLNALRRKIRRHTI